MTRAKKDLIALIRANPTAHAIVDNDSWSLYKTNPADAPTDDAGYEVWERENLLATDGDIKPLGDGGYGSGNCYGGDLLQALAAVVGVTIESV